MGGGQLQLQSFAVQSFSEKDGRDWRDFKDLMAGGADGEAGAGHAFAEE